MGDKIKTVRSTFEIEEWVQTRLKDRNRLKGYSIDSFVNEAIIEKILRSPDRSPEDRPSTGFVKVNTRLEYFVNEKLKNKNNLGHRTKESFINEAVIEKLSRDNFLAKTSEKFDLFLNRASHLLTEAINSSDFADLMKDFKGTLDNIKPDLDILELQAMQAESNFALDRAGTKLNLLYLVAHGIKPQMDYQTSELLETLMTDGYLEFSDDRVIVLSENAIPKLTDPE